MNVHVALFVDPDILFKDLPSGQEVRGETRKIRMAGQGHYYAQVDVRRLNLATGALRR